jgi:hypothetical protein
MNFLREAWGAERHDVQEVAALASRNAKLVAVVRRSITRLLRRLRSRERDSIVS